MFEYILTSCKLAHTYFIYGGKQSRSSRYISFETFYLQSLLKFPLVVNLALVVQNIPKNMLVGDTFVKQSQTFSETKSGVLHLCSVTIMGQSSIYLRENLPKWRRPFCDDNLCWTKRLQTVKTRWCKTQILSPLLSSSPLSL